MHVAAGIPAVAVVVAAGLASRPASPPPPIVGCDEIIGRASSGTADGYRLVLGVVSAAPARLTHAVPIESRPWTYWRKAGLVVRAGRAAVTVSVPDDWRKRLGITWGKRSGVVDSLRIAGCPSPPHVWNAYAGGFYMRARSACVPLTFRVGRRSATVRFGIGRSCGTSS